MRVGGDEEILAALDSDRPLSRDQVLKWSREAKALPLLRKLHQLVLESHQRIEPSLTMDDGFRVVRRYLLECIRLNPQQEGDSTRYEAGDELEGWFDHVADREGETSEILQEAASEITQLYLAGEEEVKLAIETAFLEHVLEQERLRPLFAHWAEDPRSRESWEAALAWGEAHPNFKKDLRRQVFQEEEAE